MGKEGFFIVMWHNVAPPQGLPLEISGEACSLRDFKNHIRKIKNKFRVVSLSEIIEDVIKNREVPSNSFVLTFDDGLKNHYEVVLPILKKENLSATFFVMAAPLEGRIPATFKLQLLSGRLRAEELRYEYLPRALKNGFEHLLDEIEVPIIRYRFEEQPIREVKWIINFLLSQENKDRIVNTLFEEVFPDRERNLASKMFLEEDEIKTLLEEGMEIQSHGCGHYAMSTLGKSEIRYELEHSKSVLEKIIGKKITIFAYPSAVPGKKTKPLLQDAGYLAACEYDPRRKVNLPPYDVFLLSRIHEKDLNFLGG